MLKIMNKWRIGLPKEEVKNVVAEYIVKNKIKTSFKENRQGDDCWYGLKKTLQLILEETGTSRTS